MIARLALLGSLFVLTASCTRGASRDGETSASARGDAPSHPAPTGTAPTGPAGDTKPRDAVGVVGVSGIAAWDALSAEARDRVKAVPAIYLHQSVGQDLEDGAAAVGFPFQYYGPGATAVEPGLNGGLFNDVGPIDNGKPMEKLALVEKIAKAHRGKLKVLAFSFGYADVRDDDLAQVEREYQRVASAVTATGARLLHVTPPLVFDASENGAKMKMRSWMLTTFAGEPIFDLQDIESLDGGKRCEVGGVWRICQANRSSAACPSKSQGVDGDGQGHLCSTKAADFAKALLYAIHRAGG